MRTLKQKAVVMLSPWSGLAPAYLRELFSERGTDCELRNFFHKLTSVKPCNVAFVAAAPYYGIPYPRVPEKSNQLPSSRRRLISQLCAYQIETSIIIIIIMIIITLFI